MSRIAKKYGPGLAVVAVGTLAAYAVHWLVPGFHQSSAAVLLGAIAVNLGILPERLNPGITFAAKKLLRIAVVLLGFSLSLTQVGELGFAGLALVLITVAVAFFGTLALARLLRVRRATGLLVATGFSICGASAIAAMEPVAKGKKDDTAVSIALVTLCGSLAIVVLPLLRHPLGFTDPVMFGQWVGASVHDVGQTVATANIVPGALQTAVVVKLTRVILLAPMVLLVGLAMHSRYAASKADADPTGTAKRPPLIPLFVAAFIGAIVLNSLVTLPEGVLETLKLAQEILLAAALFALGTGIHWKVMRRAGGRPLLLGLLSWVLVAGVAYAGVLAIN
ncbi:YeiH family protein [Epidermidibacterium keratini]